MDGAGVARVRTWKSVVGDHIKDEDLKTLYRNVSTNDLSRMALKQLTEPTHPYLYEH